MIVVKKLRLALSMLIMLLLAGCSVLYKPVGGTLNAYAEDVALSDFLTYQDVDLLCESGGSLLPLINSFKDVGAKTHKITTTLFLLGGFCAEQKAHEFEVLQLIADQAGDYTGAKNYAVLKQRELAKAARRQYASYQNAVTIFPSDKSANGEAACPTLAEKQDELIFLLGNLQGVEAILNDGKSGALANVPKNIVNDIYRSMDCISNVRWWGVPQAVQAALLGFLPNLDRDKAGQIDNILDVSVRMGRTKQTPLAETVALAAWEGQGADAKVEALIQSHFEYARQAEYDPNWLAVAYISNRHLENKSDILQLEAKKNMASDPSQPYLIQDEPEMELDLDDI